MKHERIFGQTCNIFISSTFVDMNSERNYLMKSVFPELKQWCKEHFIDLNVIDLYSGEISFVKVGAVPSFIKRGKIVKKISSNMPPFGLVYELDMKPIKANLKSGDIIITISDGILDVTKKEFANSNWIEKYLINAVREPKQLAQDILQKAKEFNGGVSRDDMTVVVSKISNL